MDLLHRVRRTIRQHDLARGSTRVVAAVSGGSDSVALAHLLAALADRGDLVFAGIAHFNHQLRADANADERFSESVARTIDVPFLVEREAVSERALRDGVSVETAGRTARYAFFERAAAHFRGDVVALGHTRDDQAETFLLRLIRGAGVRGLASMHPRRGPVVRPLLDCRRAELRAYLAGRGLEWVHDLSNDDRRIPRNRVRADLVPLLEEYFNPSIVEVLSEEADLARAEWEWMGAEADRHAADICYEAEGEWRLVIPALERVPTALGRILVRRALEAASDGRAVAFDHIERVRRLPADGGAPVDLPGCRVHLSGAEIVLTKRNAAGRRPDQPRPNLFAYSLSIPGEVAVEDGRWLVSAELAERAAVVASHSGTAVAVRLDRCGTGLGVRSRRPGDRFSPPGLGGRKKLQDFFVDRKVPRARRDLVPIVVDREDRIVWVAGHEIDDRFRVTDPAQAVLILRLKPVGGLA